MVRLQNHGRSWPHWMSAADLEARRGTIRVRAVDPNLICLRNERKGWWEVWGPSISAGGWVSLMVVCDDRGRAWTQNPPWELVVNAIVRGRERALSIADEVEAHNASVRAAQEKLDQDRGADGCEFFRKAVAGEAEGWGRWKADDVAAAWKRQTFGEQADPAGKVTFDLSRAAQEPSHA